MWRELHQAGEHVEKAVILAKHDRRLEHGEVQAGRAGRDGPHSLLAAAAGLQVRAGRATAAEGVVEGIETEGAPRFVEDGLGGLALGALGGGQGALGLREQVLGAAHPELHRAVRGVAADGVHLEFAGDEREVFELRREGLEETLGRRELELGAGNGVLIIATRLTAGFFGWGAALFGVLAGLAIGAFAVAAGAFGAARRVLGVLVEVGMRNLRNQCKWFIPYKS